MDMFGLGAKKSSKADKESMEGLNKALSEMSTQMNKAMEKVSEELENLIGPAVADIEKTVKDEIGKIKDGPPEVGIGKPVSAQSGGMFQNITLNTSSSPLSGSCGR
jgi:hypothetical protein